MYEKTSWKWKELVLRYYSSSLCLFPFRFTRRLDCARRRKNEFYFPEKNIFNSTSLRVLRKERTSWSRQRVLFVVGSDGEKNTKLAVYEKETAGNFILMLHRKKNSRFIRTLVHSIYIAFTHTAFVEKKTYRDSQHTSDNHGLAFLARRRKIFDDKLNKVSSIGSGWWKKDPLDGNVHPVFLGKHFCAICRLLREKSLAGKPSCLSSPAARKFKGVRRVQRPQRWQKFRRLGRKSELKEGNSERQLCWGGEAGTRRSSHCRFNFRFLAKHHHTRTRRAAKLLGLLLLNSIFYAPRL